MCLKQQPVSAGRSMAIILMLASAIAVEQGFVIDPSWYLWLLITVPLLVIKACSATK